MDISSFKLDIDELLDEYAQGGFTTLADMKRVWLSRKFSYIYEASPTKHVPLFMQSLYGHTLGRMISGTSFSHRLGGLFCLYCLYETQPFKPPFKVYLSLGDLQHLKNLTVEANESRIKVVSHLIKRMLNNNTFLIGLVDINRDSITDRVNELTALQNAQVQIAYKKLLDNTELERYVNFDLGKELGLDEIKKTSTDYANAKKLAITEASQVVEVQNIEHIAETNQLIGDVMEDITSDWNKQKEHFNQRTGGLNQAQTTHNPVPEPEDNQQYQEDEDDDAEFDQEIEHLLSLP